MTLGIELLATDDAARADELARQLDAINRERREIEGGMREQAMQIAEGLLDPEAEPRQRWPCSTPTSTKAWSASSPRA
jgi:single-stranded-DNA-specific exonuclease